MPNSRLHYSLKKTQINEDDNTFTVAMLISLVGDKLELVEGGNWDLNPDLLTESSMLPVALFPLVPHIV